MKENGDSDDDGGGDPEVQKASIVSEYNSSMPQGPGSTMSFYRIPAAIYSTD